MDTLSQLKAALDERYDIQRELGAGGMATVYLAHDVKHDRKVALKVLKPELAAVLGAERFVVEIKTTASLSHPHILPLFDSGTAGGFLYYVMPYIAGETIRDRLNRETHLPVDEAVRIAREVADALDYAHRHGIIHRDIKPENILLHDGRAMVMDFGIALAVSAAAGGRMTETGLSLGTPHYMSPEQATADKELTPRSDVYSLGSVLYEMLAGEPPHLAGSAQQIIMKIITEPAQPVTKLRRTVPPNVAAAVSRSLEKLPADRFASARAFGDALANPAFAASHGTTALPAAQAMRGGVSVRVFAAVTLPLAAVAAAAVLWATTRPEPPPPLRARFTLEIPDSQSIAPSLAGMNVSIARDGSEFVYPGVGRGGILLYRRSLADLSVRAVPGSEGPIVATYAPDGRSLLIGAGGATTRLMRVPLDGSAPLRLTDNVTGASWDTGDRILFVRGRAIWRVGRNGGAPEQLAQLDSLSVPVFPHLLPGEKAIVFNATRSGEDTNVHEVMVLRLSDRSITSLGIRGNNPRYIPTGHLLLTVEGVVQAVPFDRQALRVTGEPVPVLADVVLSANNRAARFDVSENGVLVYLARPSSSAVALVDLRGGERELNIPPGQYTHARFSPRGDRVLVERRDGDRSDVFVITRATGQIQQLTRDGFSRTPEWSADGNRIYWIRREGDQTSLWSQRSDGSGVPETVATPEGRLHQFTMAPNGRSLALAIGPNVRHDLVLVPLDPSQPARTLANSPFDEVQPAFSPDGKWLAFTSNLSGSFEVYVASVDDPSARVQISTGNGNAPIWKDGTTLLYSTATHMHSATLAFSPRIEVLRQDTLFVNEYRAGAAYRAYDFSRALGEFVVPTSAGRGRTRLVVVLGWFEELRERLAQGSQP